MNKNIIKKNILSASAILVLVAVILAVNIGAAFIPENLTSLDITTSGKFTISNETKIFLETVDLPITIYVLNSDGSDPHFETFLRRYAICGEDIDVKFVNTTADPTFLTSRGYEAATQVSPYTLMIESEYRAYPINYSSFFSYTNKEIGFEGISASDYNYYYAYYSSSEDYKDALQKLTYGTTRSFAGEAVLSSIVEYVSHEIIPRLYLISGHGEDSATEGNLAYFLSMVGYDFGVVDVTESGTIPRDAGCIVINSPESDYSDTETEQILNYLKNGGRLLLITNEENLKMPNLMSIAKYYGMTAAEGALIEEREAENEDTEGALEQGTEAQDQESDDGQTEEEEPSTAVMPNINYNHDILAAFPEMYESILAIKTANPIYFSEELRDSQLLTKILFTSENAYHVDPEKKEEYVIGAVAEEETENGTTVLAWFTGGDSYNGEDADSQNNIALMVYSLGWMGDTYKTELKPVEPVIYEDPALNIPAKTALSMSVSAVIVIPAAIIICGAVVQFKRKKAK